MKEKMAEKTTEQAQAKKITVGRPTHGTVTLFRGLQTITVPEAAASALLPDGWTDVKPIRVAADVIVNRVSPQLTRSGKQVRLGTIEIHLREAFKISDGNGGQITVPASRLLPVGGTARVSVGDAEDMRINAEAYVG